MSKMLHGLITAAILATASATAMGAWAGDDSAEAERNLNIVIKGRVAGQPVSCINPGRIRGIEVIPRTAIIYRMSNGQIYVNRPTQGIQNLDGEGIINIGDTPGPLCTNQFVTFYDQGGKSMRGVTASVAMGPFVPYAVAQR